MIESLLLGTMNGNFSTITDAITLGLNSQEDLAQKVEAAGFETKECEYVCVRLVNRKRDLEMKRVFVHGVFQRPY
jgi:hypothetical protein